MEKIVSKGILAAVLFLFLLSLGSTPAIASVMTEEETMETEEKQFIDYFPDVNFAKEIAKIFGRQHTDFVTVEELSNPIIVKINYKNISDISGIHYLKRLQQLDLSHNKIVEVPPIIGSLVQLTHLNLDDNQIEEMPSTIGNLFRLKDLRLNRNKLVTIPSTIGKLVNMEYIGLGINQLTSLPPEISKLTKLHTLYLNQNQLGEISPGIGDLVNLTALYLNKNQLDEIPSTIGNLVKLSVLNLESNQLSEIPSTFGNLVNLSSLNLGDNQLTEISPAIDNLDRLVSLNLFNNKISAAPSENIEALFERAKMVLINQKAELDPLNINLNDTIEYTSVISPIVQQIQKLNGGELKGYYMIYEPDGNLIVIAADLQNTMNQFVFAQAGEYVIEYCVDPDLKYVVKNRDVYNLNYTTKIMVGDEEIEEPTETPQPFQLEASFYIQAISDTEEYKLALNGFIEAEVIEGSSILTLSQIKEQLIAITVINQKTGEKRIMDQGTIEGIEIIVENGTATNIILNGRVQTSNGKLDRYTVTAALQ